MIRNIETNVHIKDVVFDSSRNVFVITVYINDIPAKVVVPYGEGITMSQYIIDVTNMCPCDCH